MTWNENPPVVVILARQFNPSVITQLWLSRQGILDENGTYKPESILTTNLVQITTDEFVLVVTPDQLQFVPVVPVERQEAIIRDKVGKLVRSLPHIPYRAVGLNFNWHLTPPDGTVSEVTRELFARCQDGIYTHFRDKNSRFGAYLSKDYGHFRLKLDVKPINLETEGQKEDRVQFTFNFHYDISACENAETDVCNRLDQWNDVREEALRTIRSAGYKG